MSDLNNALIDAWTVDQSDRPVRLDQINLFSRNKPDLVVRKSVGRQDAPDGQASLGHEPDFDSGFDDQLTCGRNYLLY